MVHRSVRMFRALLAGLAVLSACSTSSSTSSKSSRAAGTLAVVAAEDSWGSIARQLGGAHVDVKTLITNPDADPHEYEPTPGDARAIASAKFVITNGIGYDPWVDKLLAADRAGGRRVLKVGGLVGLKEGDNPHQWYSPDVVDKVVAAIVDTYKG